MSRADEAMKVSSALKTQLSRLSQLESDNKKLTEDNAYLRQPDFYNLFDSIHSLYRSILIARKYGLVVHVVDLSAKSLR